MSLPYILMLAATAEDNISKSMDTTTPLGERVMQGVQTTLLGLGIVFIVLLLLLGVLELFKIIFSRTKKTLSTESNSEVLSIADSTPMLNTSNEELIAVISAAVAAYMNDTADSMASAIPDTKFKVVSFRKVK